MFPLLIQHQVELTLAKLTSKEEIMDSELPQMYFKTLLLQRLTQVPSFLQTYYSGVQVFWARVFHNK